MPAIGTSQFDFGRRLSANKALRICSHVLQVVADPFSNHLALGTHLWRICYATHGIAIKVQVKESFTWICCESFFECSYGR